MRFIILGAGGYGQTVADVARQSGRYSEILFLDDHSPLAVGKCADYETWNDGDTQMLPAFGNNEARLSWLDQLEMAHISVPTLIHATAYVSPEAKIAPGCVILPKAVVNTGCEVKRGCIVNIGALIDHGTVLEEGAHAAPGAIVKAENRIPGCMKIEAGQVIENRTYPL